LPADRQLPVSEPGAAPPAAPTRVALVGLGHMGVPMAERLLDAGYQLTVFNRTIEKARPLIERGAELADGLSRLLVGADICVTVLSDDMALEAVAKGPGGVLGSARRGTVLIDMSTVSVAASARVADAAERVGVSFLRAPVSGNPVVVRSGNLAVIVSGARAAFERAEAVVRAIGPNVYYVGTRDEARVVKLVLQVMIGGTAQLMAESLALGEAGGVSRAQLLEVMGNSAAGSPFVKYKTEPLVRDDYSPTFTTAMMKKDIDLVLELAEEQGATLPLAAELGRLLEAAVAGSYAELDLMALYPALRGIPAARVAGGGAAPS
jgi:3-hydroxyisobutyrate dehydrogenase-like beta-hydroxyacid dehydrogenase